MQQVTNLSTDPKLEKIKQGYKNKQNKQLAVAVSPKSKSDTTKRKNGEEKQSKQFVVPIPANPKSEIIKRENVAHIIVSKPKNPVYSVRINLENLENYVKESLKNGEIEKQHSVSK